MPLTVLSSGQRILAEAVLRGTDDKRYLANRRSLGLRQKRHVLRRHGIVSKQKIFVVECPPLQKGGHSIF
ncbi:hypothetical protein SAMN04488523_1417 [Sulfitobacter brevis]|uniref:Uncharacterized protein n=1 Tax=Sulfitobacter brevis TaxID=74348 RepID=A0A1I2HAJ7_9RHOB|nr:hypothetical protein SAMN04488523_1417 [Sulfitobacter brevis]